VNRAAVHTCPQLSTAARFRVHQSLFSIILLTIGMIERATEVPYCPVSEASYFQDIMTIFHQFVNCTCAAEIELGSRASGGRASWVRVRAALVIVWAKLSAA
jgi:hypothetical protein